jgi:hypothetical protein
LCSWPMGATGHVGGAPHAMTTALYLIISGVLMGAGISIIWRDMQKRRRGTFVSRRDARPGAEPDVEITISQRAEPDTDTTIPHRTEPEPTPLPVAALATAELSPLRTVAEAHAPSPSPRSRHAQGVPSAQREGHGGSVPAARGGGQPLVVSRPSVPHPNSLAGEEWGEEAGATPAPPAPVARTVAGNVDQPRQGARLAFEQRWSALQPAIATAVEQTNAVLAAVRLFIGPVGEPSWSYKNKGYGAYRRLLMAGESMAWLRLELLVDGQLRASVKAHKEDRAAVNAVADVPAAGLDAARISDLFSQCLQAAALYATLQIRDSDKEASEQAWASVEALVAAALKATNGVLAQTGAQLVALAPAAWESELRRHRMALSVEVNGDDVARMLIERLPYEMEVAVGIREPQLADLGRRRRIPVDGMTIHALAELIASCAWPAIARFRESRRQA